MLRFQDTGYQTFFKTFNKELKLPTIRKWGVLVICFHINSIF